MSSFRSKARLPGRLIAVALGVLLLAHLIRRAGPAKLLEGIASVGWGLVLVIGLTGLAHVVRTWAWRLTLLDEKRHASFIRMFALRLGSEAVGQIGGVGTLFGETLRVVRLSPDLPLASRVASVTLDRALFTLSAAVVTTAGMTAVLFVLPLPHGFTVYAGLFLFTLLVIVFATAVAVQKRWAVLSGTANALGRIGRFGGWIERKRSVILTVEEKLLNVYRNTPGMFWGCFALNLVSHCAAILEVYLILRLMGAQVSLFAALAVEALTKLVNFVGLFNPGNIGTYEGGNMLFGKLLGLGGAAGLTLGLIRRVRSLFWAAIGGLCLAVLSKTSQRNDLQDSARDRSQDPAKEVPPPVARSKSKQDGHSHVAVILANILQGDGGVARVGCLPVLLRAILGAEKAGAARIVVVAGPAEASRMKSELLSTRRLPASVEWYRSGAGESSLPSILEDIAGGEERMVLIAADRTYHPALHRRAAEWNAADDALALTTDSRLAGIYVLPTSWATELAKRCPSGTRTLERLYDCLTSSQSVICETVPEDQWQCVSTPQDRLSAERKLDRWLFKSTDGVFARTNRRISIPISRQLIKFPITPNMVSLFTLGVSFLSGVYFGLGGWMHMVVGALLSLAASILDGCDGEVARLKFQESDFGCWMDTICDYLYYVFVFVGMTFGLARSSGDQAYFLWGALLLFGAIASFLTTGMQRRRLAAGRPEQLLRLWQEQALKRRSNPFMYLARYTEFVIRRCFLPYAFLFFALFNITNVAFILAAVGSNIVWPIALYSYFTFNAGRTSVPRLV